MKIKKKILILFFIGIHLAISENTYFKYQDYKNNEYNHKINDINVYKNNNFTELNIKISCDNPSSVENALVKISTTAISFIPTIGKTLSSIATFFHNYFRPNNSNNWECIAGRIAEIIDQTVDKAVLALKSGDLAESFDTLRLYSERYNRLDTKKITAIEDYLNTLTLTDQSLSNKAVNLMSSSTSDKNFNLLLLPLFVQAANNHIMMLKSASDWLTNNPEYTHPANFDSKVKESYTTYTDHIMNTYWKRYDELRNPEGSFSYSRRNNFERSMTLQVFDLATLWPKFLLKESRYGIEYTSILTRPIFSEYFGCDTNVGFCNGRPRNDGEKEKLEKNIMYDKYKGRLKRITTYRGEGYSYPSEFCGIEHYYDKTDTYITTGSKCDNPATSNSYTFDMIKNDVIGYKEKNHYCTKYFDPLAALTLQGQFIPAPNGAHPGGNYDKHYFEVPDNHTITKIIFPQLNRENHGSSCNSNWKDIMFFQYRILDSKTIKEIKSGNQILRIPGEFNLGGVQELYGINYLLGHMNIKNNKNGYMPFSDIKLPSDFNKYKYKIRFLGTAYYTYKIQIYPSANTEFDIQTISHSSPFIRTGNMDQRTLKYTIYESNYFEIKRLSTDNYFNIRIYPDSIDKYVDYGAIELIQIKKDIVRTIKKDFKLLFVCKSDYNNSNVCNSFPGDSDKTTMFHIDPNTDKMDILTNISFTLKAEYTDSDLYSIILVDCSKGTMLTRCEMKSLLSKYGSVNISSLINCKNSEIKDDC